MKSINNIFEMVKADRYTADGREEIIKAQEAETQDARRYKTGEISEATGLQKQPDGSWAPPKKGAPAGAKQEVQSSEKSLKHSGKPDQSPAENLAAWEKSAMTEARILGENQVILQNEMGDVTFYSEGNDEAIEKAESKGFKKMSLIRPDGSVKRHQGNNPEAKQEEIGKFYTKFDDVQGAYDAGRQTFPEGGYTIFKTPEGKYKVVDDPKTKQRMQDAGYEVEVDVPDGTKPPKSPAPKLTGDTKIKVKK